MDPILDWLAHAPIYITAPIPLLSFVIACFTIYKIYKLRATVDLNQNGQKGPVRLPDGDPGIENIIIPYEHGFEAAKLVMQHKQQRYIYTLAISAIVFLLSLFATRIFQKKAK